MTFSMVLVPKSGIRKMRFQSFTRLLGLSINLVD